MKINIKSLELIEKGLSSKTVLKLNESQINILHSKLFNEQPQPQVINKSVKQIVLPSGSQTTVGGVSVSNVGGKTTITPTTEQEMDEDVEVSDDPNKDKETQSSHQVGPSSDDGFGDDDDGMGMMEEKKYKKGEPNPWAICHAQVGPKKTRKFERCVQSVKKQLKEGKNPVSLFLENEIMKIVERNLPPKITKGDLMKYLSEGENFATKHIQSNFGTKSSPKVKKEVGENSPATAPTTKPAPTKTPGTKTPPKPRPAHPGKNPNPGENPSPKAKYKKEVGENSPLTAPTKPAPTKTPGTKTPPKPRPAHPGKNPNPGENPSPKAKKVSPEKAKEEVIDVIIKLLEK